MLHPKKDHPWSHPLDIFEHIQLTNLTSSQSGAWAPGWATGTSRVGMVKSTKVKPPPDCKNENMTLLSHSGVLCVHGLPWRFTLYKLRVCLAYRFNRDNQPLAAFTTRHLISCALWPTGESVNALVHHAFMLVWLARPSHEGLASQTTFMLPRTTGSFNQLVGKSSTGIKVSSTLYKFYPTRVQAYLVLPYFSIASLNSSLYLTDPGGKISIANL